MAGTCQYSNILSRDAIFLSEIFRDNQVVIGYNTFDGSYDEFILNLSLQFLQVNLQIRGRCNEDERIRFFHDIIDVGVEVDTLGIKLDARQVGRVMAKPFEVGNTVVSPHIPVYRLRLGQYHFGNGSCPTSSAHDGYLTG